MNQPLALVGAWPPRSGASTCRISRERAVDLKHRRCPPQLDEEALEERLEAMRARGVSIAWDAEDGCFLLAWEDDPHAWRDTDHFRVNFAALLERFGLKAHAGGISPTTPLAKLPLVFCDVETTGGSTEKHRICELALCRVEPYGDPVWLASLVNPGQPITNSWIHKITNAMVAKKPMFADLAEEAATLLEGAVFVSHQTNGIDRRFVAAELATAGISWTPAAELNTCRMAKALFPNLGSHKLQDLIRTLGIRAQREHRASDDTQAMMDLFYQHLLPRARGAVTLADLQRL